MELLRAILAGDPDRADESMHRHVTNFEQQIRKALVER
jgi:DNA-binding FadR family transcriptional regulator